MIGELAAAAPMVQVAGLGQAVASAVQELDMEQVAGLVVLVSGREQVVELAVQVVALVLQIRNRLPRPGQAASCYTTTTD